MTAPSEPECWRRVFYASLENLSLPFGVGCEANAEYRVLDFGFGV